MRRVIGAIVLLLAAAGLAGAAVSQFSGQPALNPNEAGRWHPMRDETYMESWSFHARADDGGFFFAVVLVSNAGLYDNNPGINVSYYAPNGRIYSNELRIDNGRFQAATDRFDVHAGKARFWQDGRDYRLSIQEGKVTAEMTLTPTAPLWRNGTGRLLLGKNNDTWNWLMTAPRGRVSGTVASGGQTFKVTGTGYTDHCWSNEAYFSFSKNWFSLHVSTPVRTVDFHQIVKLQKRGAEIVRSLMAVRDGQQPRHTDAVDLEILQWQATKKYRHPVAFNLHGRIDDTEYFVEARNGRYGETIDPLGPCSYVEQKIVRLLVADPMLYRLRMDTTIRTVKNGVTETETFPGIANLLYFEQ